MSCQSTLIPMLRKKSLLRKITKRRYLSLSLLKGALYLALCINLPIDIYIRRDRVYNTLQRPCNLFSFCFPSFFLSTQLSISIQQSDFFFFFLSRDTRQESDTDRRLFVVDSPYIENEQSKLSSTDTERKKDSHRQIRTRTVDIARDERRRLPISSYRQCYLPNLPVSLQLFVFYLCASFYLSFHAHPAYLYLDLSKHLSIYL